MDNTQNAIPPFGAADGRRLAELQRRVAEAREVVTCACNYATRPEQIAEAAKHYGDALREYRAALESPTAEVSEGGTRDSRIETAAQSRPSLH